MHRMHKCKSHCRCGFQLVLCEYDVVNRIQTAHREAYGLPFPTPNNEWAARCRKCGRTYLILGHNSPEGETVTLYPHFFYHTIISWNQQRRYEQRLGWVTLHELEAYWKKTVPELAWEAAMVNAYEYDLAERESIAKRRRSFVYGAKQADLYKDTPFRKEHDLALTIPYLG